MNYQMAMNEFIDYVVGTTETKTPDFLTPISIMIEGKEYFHGDLITCRIHSTIINDAKIYIGRKNPDDTAEIYICQNEIKGDDAPHKFGYKYSWYTFIRSNQNMLGRDGIYDLKKKSMVCFDEIIEQAFPKR
jgi:hypothetical protein